jgi:putative DNA primase/helicase
MAAVISGPDDGPWEAVHPPPANGNGAALNIDDIPDLSLGEDYENHGAYEGHIEPLGDVRTFDDYSKHLDKVWETPTPPLGINTGAFARNRPQQEQEPPAIITRRASDITPEPISWLWKYWLARGKLHLIGGVPETGKTTIALSYAAVVSSGATWPDGTRAAVGNVLIWTSEDDPADTIVPRLVRMDADRSRIHFIEEAIPPGAKSRPFNPATDMLALVAKARAIGDVALLILDPVVAAMPMTRNSHNNAETRNGMQPVVDFAKTADIATIGIGHLTKGTAGKDPLERLNGSGAFGALPRLVMGAAKNEADAGEDKPDRIMVRIKSNIGPSGGGFGYHIDTAPLLERPDIEATRIVWEHPLEGTARELLAEAEGQDDEDDKTSKIAEAMVFLKTALEKGERLQREIMAEAKSNGIAEKTLRRAAKTTTGKRKAALGWYWWWRP